jgi:DNA polymerase-3 subunit chi
MAEIGFYHLTRSRRAEALPALLGRTLAAGERAVVLCETPEELAALDTALWTCPNPDWLPHGTQATPHPEWQPIYLTLADENPANAAFLFRLGGTPDVTAYRRVFDLFDGTNEDQVAAARARWTAAKAAGHTLTYWRQTAQGWEKSA